jgi:hypothetical protein
MLFLRLSLVLAFAASAFAESNATNMTVGEGPNSVACIKPDPLSKCFQQRVLFFEGLILWGVMLLAALMGTTCLAALNTPTKFPQPKERTE